MIYKFGGVDKNEVRIKFKFYNFVLNNLKKIIDVLKIFLKEFELMDINIR